MDRVIGGVYRIKKRLGSGSFGMIYLVEHVDSLQEYACKIEKNDCDVPQLHYEAKLYKAFQGGEHIPRIYWTGSSPSYNYLVMDLLGTSLADAFTKQGNKLSLKTVLMCADQMLEAIQYFHERDYMHRDIKPDNFMVGTGRNSYRIFIIDYGLAKRYREKDTRRHIKYVEGKSLTGTARYASIGALRGHEQSRRDDLEALGYVWLYLLKGSLPWMGIEARDREEKYRKIAESKERHLFTDLCDGVPHEFSQYFQIVTNLEFTENPNYERLRGLFKTCMAKHAFKFDNRYDWCNNDRPMPYQAENLSTGRLHLERSGGMDPKARAKAHHDTRSGSRNVVKTPDYKANPRPSPRRVDVRNTPGKGGPPPPPRRVPREQCPGAPSPPPMMQAAAQKRAV